MIKHILLPYLHWAEGVILLPCMTFKAQRAWKATNNAICLSVICYKESEIGSRLVVILKQKMNEVYSKNVSTRYWIHKMVLNCFHHMNMSEWEIEIWTRQSLLRRIRNLHSLSLVSGNIYSKHKQWRCTAMQQSIIDSLNF